MESAHLETTRLLINLGNGDPKAAARLLPLVYDELRSVAARYFRRQGANHTLQPTALVHEAFLKLVDQTQAKWKDRAHFFAVAAQAMRQILVNHARARGAEKRGGGRAKIAFADDMAAAASPGEFDPLALDEALTRLAALDERKAKVVELRFFSGLSVEEVAEVLGVSLTTIEGDWRMARAWLSRALSAEETR
jgi:RNA polymerase sigma factor (TIGR02999 family)